MGGLPGGLSPSAIDNLAGLSNCYPDHKQGRKQPATVPWRSAPAFAAALARTHASPPSANPRQSPRRLLARRHAEWGFALTEEALEAYRSDGPKAGMAVKKGPSHLLGNSAWNATAFAVAVLLNLAILPFVIFRLGLAAFGVAGLVTACAAPALMFSNALGLSTARELAQRLEPSDHDQARRFFGTALALAIVLGGLIAALLAFAGAPLARRGFHLGGPAAEDLGLAFALAGAGWLFQCLFAVFLSLFTARQDYRRIASISITGTVVTTMSMLLLIPYAPRASTFLGCQALGFATNLVMAFAWSRHALSDWLARPALDRGALRALVKLGGWQFAAQSGALFAGQADRYLLGALLQPQFVGFYSVAQRLEEAVYIGVLKIGEILFPFFSTLQREDDDRKVDLLLRSS
ncbi:lipopolysaccharide biosynthesis protein [Bradyrhizobium sp. BR 1433]|uniref:lipopolysaccharide biosynthesis protein n=1 Tax=Bradyrhizobium sp. BR 1433 TaxID=3447967 RepID=UPI003EE6043E